MDQPQRTPLSLTPWVRRILVTNAVLYALAITVFTGPWLIETGGFRPLAASRQPWTFLSYMFLHQGFFHLAAGLLMLFFLGPRVERRMGAVSFLRYYFLCALGGTTLCFALILLTDISPFIGATGAVLGVSLASAWDRPEDEVFLFPLTVPIKLKWLVFGLSAAALAVAVAGAGGGVVQLAHLGGVLFGYIYLRAESYVSRRVTAVMDEGPDSHVLVHPSAEQAEPSVEAPAQKSGRKESIHKKIDRVLDKISESGLESLTPEERRFLDDMSRQWRTE